MNKDLDERLVPNGEYRDALNIEISTSEGSNVGTAQNVKGNQLATLKDHNNNSFTLSDNAITVASYADESSKKIFNFIHKASDLVANGVYGAHTRFTGARSDVISEYTALSAAEDGIVYPLVTDVYEAREVVDVQPSNNGIITGVETYSIPFLGGNLFFPKHIRPGMRVRLLAPDNQDLFIGEKIIVKDIVPAATASGVMVLTTIPYSLNGIFYTQALIDLGFVFQFTSERILNFQHGVQEIESNTTGTPTSNTPENTMITGIKYTDNILFYTDGRTEPKRIVVDRFKNLNGDYFSFNDIAIHSKHVYRDNNGAQHENFLTEDNITTIRRNPTTAPLVSTKLTSREPTTILINGANSGYSYDDTVSSPIFKWNPSGFSEPFALSDSGNVKFQAGEEFYIEATNGRPHWKVNDILRITGNTTASFAKLKIINFLSGSSGSSVNPYGTFNKFRVALVDVDESYVGTEVDEVWTAVLVEKDAIYRDKFIYFAYRYKYVDGEYSCISPYSTGVFLPNNYSYSANGGFNRGMESACKSITIKDFITTNTPNDVQSIQILLKDSSSELVQVIKEINRSKLATDPWNLPGTHAFGYLELDSESFGFALPSNQTLRTFDLLPKKAKAQEISASRVLYGNYTEGFDLVDSRNIKIKPSIKSFIENIKNDFTATFFASNNLEAEMQADLVTTATSGVSTSGESVWEMPHHDQGLGTGLTSNQSFPHYRYPFFYPGLNVWPPGPNSFNSTTGYGNNNLLTLYSNNSGKSIYIKADGTSIGDDVNNDGYRWPGYQLIPFNFENDDQNNWNQASFDYTIPEEGTYIIRASVDAYFAASNTETAHPNAGKSFPDVEIQLLCAKVDGNGNPIIKDINFVAPSMMGNAINPTNNWDPLEFMDVVIEGTKSMCQPVPASVGVRRARRSIETADSSYMKDLYVNPISQPQGYATVPLVVGPNTQVQVGDKIGFFLVTTSNNVKEITHNGGGNYSDVVDALTAKQRGVKISKAKLEIQAPNGPVDVLVKSGAPSVKSLRTYEIGVVYLDGKGRETTVIVDESAELKNPKDNSLNQNRINVKIQHEAPYWAKYYKFFIKEIGPEYNNVVLYKGYPNDNLSTSPGTTVYVWLSFNSSDVNKISLNDYLVLKKEHGNNKAVTDVNARFRVLDIVANTEMVDDDNNAATPDVPQIKGVTLDASSQDLSGKFFVKIEADEFYTKYITQDDTLPTPDENINNGAVFEVEKPINIDLDLFYEVSQAYPIFLDKQKASTFIKPNSTITLVESGNINLSQAQKNFHATVTSVVGAHVRADSYTSNSTSVNYSPNPSGSYFPTDDNYHCRVSLSNNIPQAINLGSFFEVKFQTADGGAVTAWAQAFGNNGSTLYIYPYTHPVAGSNYYCSTITLPWNNCYTFGNGVESDRIRDDFNSPAVYPYIANGKTSGFKASLNDPDYKEINKKNDIIFSQIYNDDTRTARYNEFIFADKIVKKLNSEYGSIQKLYSRDGDVVAFCESKVLKILSSGKDALFNAEGKPNLLSSSNVLGQAIPFKGDYGISKNPESFAVEEYRIYFADKNRGAICRLSMDGITAISDQGMKDWFNDNLETASAIVGSYDGKKNQYNVTIHKSTNPGYKKEVHTVSYSESVKGWPSFKSFIKESGVSMDNEYYTFKNGDMYLHHPDQKDVLRNNFYGTQYNSTIKVLFNDDPGSVKLFKTVNYEGSQAKEL